jgi:hypothetical protein
MVNIEAPHDPWFRNLGVGTIMRIIGGPILSDRLGTLRYSSATGFPGPKLPVGEVRGSLAMKVETEPVTDHSSTILFGCGLAVVFIAIMALNAISY